MAHRFPPEDLPEGYLPVWEALAQADRYATSRQTLAADLGVATYTLQRILVDGNVPRFPETTSARIAHAWVRTLTRLAVRFGAEPRDWVTGIGIEWDDSIRRIAEKTAHRVGRSSEGIVGRRLGEGRVAVTTAIESSQSLRRTVRIGIADLPPFSGQLPGFPESFLARYGSRLVHAIDPNATIQIETASEADLVAGLDAEEPEIDLTVGLLETLPRRGMGSDFVRLPGWRIRLRAIEISRPETFAKTRPWSEVVSPIGVYVHDFLIPKGSVARDYLVGQCGVPELSLTIAPTQEIDELADLLLSEMPPKKGRSVIFVADEPTCRRLYRHLRSKCTVNDGRNPVWLPGEAEEYPSYPLSLAWSRKLDPYSELSAEAVRDELFGSSIIHTGFLYASLIAIGFLHGTSPDWGGGELAIPSWRPEPFDEANEAFRHTLCRHLVVTLNEGLTARRALRGEVSPPEALHASTFGEIGRNLDRLVPKAWQPTLVTELRRLAARSRLLRTSETTENRLPFCHSCSSLLFDGIHGGVSDRYCRFCADETGRLKPRDQVEQLLSRWIGNWEGGVPTREAARGAIALMDQMPAWGAN